jgi:hypothetical protein
MDKEKLGARQVVGRVDMVLLSDVAFFGAFRQSEIKIAIVSIEHSRNM